MALLVSRSLCRHVTPLTSFPSLAKGLHVAVIGSGPAGFYVAQHLVKRDGVHVSILEKWPVPFGLVRSGVAPDHPEVKNVVNSFSKTASSSRVSFLGNVSVGTHVTLQELRQAFHVIVLCYGSARDRSLNITGEDEKNVISAHRFVGWYNGAPEDQNLDVDLTVDSCLIIGHGNVALDCARILATPYSLLKTTDITKQSLQKLQQSNIREIRLVGRRGPLQVAFTIKELRELTKVPDCQTVISREDFSLIDSSTDNNFMANLPRPRKRLTELIKSIAESTTQLSAKKCLIQFLRSPLSITRISDSKMRVEFAVNQLDDPTSEDAKVQCTNDRQVLETGMVIKSIGYTTVPLDPSIPIDDKRGCIVNAGGKIPGLGPGLYCSGWAATGPTGVLLGTMNFSFDVARNILHDVDAGEIVVDDRKGVDTLTQLLSERNVQFVTFDDWSRIDQLEREEGKKEGKPREKFVSVKDMVAAAKSCKDEPK